VTQKLCTLMYLSTRRNKTLRFEILLLFFHDIASPSFIYGYVCQVAVMAVTKQARGPSFSRSLALIFADKSLPLGNRMPYSTQLCFKDYLSHPYEYSVELALRVTLYNN